MNPIQPVNPADFMATFLAAAGVILGGLGYALFYAAARLQNRPSLHRAALLAFALLAACLLVLVKTAHLDGVWQGLALLLLLGYRVAPPAIFHLCHLTHAPHDEEFPVSITPP